MTTTVDAPRSARLDLRLPIEARATIERAATSNGMSLTDYVLSVVLPAARRDVLDDSAIRLTDRGWREFTDFLDAPDNDRLAALRKHRPNWGAARA